MNCDPGTGRYATFFPQFYNVIRILQQPGKTGRQAWTYPATGQVMTVPASRCYRMKGRAKSAAADHRDRESKEVVEKVR